ncbi:MAG: DUF2652 domain-containing protein [Flavobacteriales bacterium]
MAKSSILFLPDISGYTKFVQTTEIEHSLHVISELLEILIEANTQDFVLAEIEGDALFFYKEEVPSQEKLLAQVETMFTAFYSHLKLLENNRICPCNACSSAVNLELKIIIHAGPLQFIEVKGNRKPFGKEVIEVHRLMKNSVNSDSYVLLSQNLSQELKLSDNYSSTLFNFDKGEDEYDGQSVPYIYSKLDQSHLKLKPFQYSKSIEFDKAPEILHEMKFNRSASVVLEYITNYKFRHHWVKGFEKFEYNENEVTRKGTEHTCVINGKHLDFVAVTKDGKPDELVYGELTSNIPFTDKVYQFFVIKPLTNTSCMLTFEMKIENQVFWKKWFVALILKPSIKKNTYKALEQLHDFLEQEK